MNNVSNRSERRLEILAADLAELQRRTAQQRIYAAIEDAKRRTAKLRPGRTDILKLYQVESAIRKIGDGEAVLSITRSLHCSSAALYRALAAR
jgi:DNA invertase Pin-like site-specific DNA recombinase